MNDGLLGVQLSDITSAVRTELAAKAERISTGGMTSASLLDALSTEAASFASDARLVKRAVRQMYRNDEFYMKTVDENLEAAWAVTR